MTKQEALDIGADLAAEERASLTRQIMERFIALSGLVATDPEMIDVHDRLTLTSIEVLRQAIATDLPAKVVARHVARTRAAAGRN